MVNRLQKLLLRVIPSAVLLVAPLFLPLALSAQKGGNLHPLFDSIAIAHKTIAILPFQIRTTYQKQPSELKPGQITIVDYNACFDFQHALSNLLTRGKESGPLTIVVADAHVLNGKIREQTGDSLLGKDFKPEEVNKYVSADAYIVGFLARNVMNENGGGGSGNTGAAALDGGGGGGGSGAVTVCNWKSTLILFETKSNQQLWKYDEVYEQSNTETEKDVATLLMRRVAKKFPYRIARKK